MRFEELYDRNRLIAEKTLEAMEDGNCEYRWPSSLGADEELWQTGFPLRMRSCIIDELEWRPYAEGGVGMKVVEQVILFMRQIPGDPRGFMKEGAYILIPMEFYERYHMDWVHQGSEGRSTLQFELLEHECVTMQRHFSLMHM